MATYVMPRLSREATWVLVLFVAINLFNYIDRNAVSAVLPGINDTFFPQTEDSIEFRDTQSSLVFFSFMLVFCIAAPLVSLIVDRWRLPRKPVLVLGVLVWSGATVLTAFVETFGQLLLLRGLLGIGEATFVALAPGVLSDFFGPKQRNKALMWFYLTIPVGAGIAFVLAGNIVELAETANWFPDNQGWRAPFIAFGAPGFILALFFLLMREPQRGRLDDVPLVTVSKKFLKELFTNRAFIYVTLGMMFLTFTMGGLQFLTAPFLVRQFYPDDPLSHLDTVGVLFGGALLVGGLLGTLGGGWLADRLGRKATSYGNVSGWGLALATPLVAISLISTQLIPESWDPQIGVLICSLIMVPAIMLALANMAPSNAILVNSVGPHIRTTAFALSTLIYHAGGDMISPTVVGLVSDLSGGGSHGLFIGLMAIVPVLIPGAIAFIMAGKRLGGSSSTPAQTLENGKPKR